MNRALVIWGVGMLSMACAMEHRQDQPFLQTHVHAIEQIGAVADFVDTTTRVVFLDIDDTVLMPRNNIAATTQWTIAFRRYLQKTYSALGPILINAVVTQYVVRALATMEPTLVQDETILLINQLMAQGVPVIFLTGRPLASAQDTYSHLARVHIDLERRQGLFDDSFTLRMGDSPAPVVCAHHVIVCNGNSKGKVLKGMFDRAGFWPEKFVVVDDDENFLRGIDREFADTPHAQFVGVWYRCPRIKPVEFTQEMLPSDLSEAIVHARSYAHETDGCSPH